MSTFETHARSLSSLLTTSRPQHRAQPAAKWVNPAAREGTGLEGSMEAVFTNPCNWIATMARSWVKVVPEATKSEHCSMADCRAALYASNTTMLKYFGRRKEAIERSIKSKRSLSHLTGLVRPGNVSDCLSESVGKLNSTQATTQRERTHLSKRSTI
jgi:hypothetical protein